MTILQLLLVAFVVFNCILIVILRVRPEVRLATGGKALGFLALFVLPVLTLAGGTAHHLDKATSTEFCLSCHVMEPYGRSLQIDSPLHLPAVHTQNNYVPPERSCYACHTSYTMFGDVRAKLQGMRHVAVNYFGTPPDRLQLYQPFANQDCLGCHGSGRQFEEHVIHAPILRELIDGDTSCLQCHAAMHAIDQLDELPVWIRPDSAGVTP